MSKDGQELTEKDFELLSNLGQGGYGSVILARNRVDKKLYALKVILKIKTIERQNIEQLKTEKFVLQQIRHPFLVSLDYCLNTPTRVIFVLEFIQGGDLFNLHRRKKGFLEEE